MLSENMRWFCVPGSEILVRKKSIPAGSRGQKNHRIPDPQPCIYSNLYLSCFGIDVTVFFVYQVWSGSRQFGRQWEISNFYSGLCKQRFIENLSHCLHGYIIFDVIKPFLEIVSCLTLHFVMFSGWTVFTSCCSSSRSVSSSIWPSLSRLPSTRTPTSLVSFSSAPPPPPRHSFSFLWEQSLFFLSSTLILILK